MVYGRQLEVRFCIFSGQKVVLDALTRSPDNFIIDKPIKTIQNVKPINGKKGRFVGPAVQM